MKKQTDLAALKQLARVFLMMDPEPTEFSPMVVKHPFTDSGMTAVKDGSGYRVVDIMVDDAALTLWRDNMAEIIDNAKNPRHICMMLTKSYRFAFLKHAMPHFSQKDFSEYLADAWIMCEAPNNDPNFTQKQLLGLFTKADPQVLMTPDEYERYEELSRNTRGGSVVDAAILTIIWPEYESMEGMRQHAFCFFRDMQLLPDELMEADNEPQICGEEGIGI